MPTIKKPTVKITITKKPTTPKKKSGKKAYV